MISNNSKKNTSFQKVEQKHSFTPRPMPQAKPANQPVNDKPSKTGKK